ncbi:hypothetical protein BD770DRAFT_449223 [Pilaira anomala]|nr:hypothetical protein BD770DRAFT_449223 [Pilaira anomala]
MEQQLIQVTQNEESQTKKLQSKHYTKDDMMHIAELYEGYYLIVNTRGNVLSPHRMQINKAHWTELTAKYNERQEAIPNNEDIVRTEKALTDKWLAMRGQYQAKKDSIKSTGSGGGPISGYLMKMHEFLHEDPQFRPKAVYISLKRCYTIRDNDEDLDLSGDEGSSTSASTPSAFFSSKKRKQKKSRTSVQDEREVARLKSRDEALDQMKQITENITSKLEEVMSKPLVVQLVDSDEKK